MKKQDKPGAQGKDSKVEWYFLALVAFTYVALYTFRPDLALDSLHESKNIFIKILPALGIIFVVMTLINYFVSKKTIKSYLGVSSGPKRWLIAIVSGVLSTGPIYAWYPLLSGLREKGLDYGFITTFLYNRAVKLPLLPLLIYYFSPLFTGVLLGVMIAVSVLQGLVFAQLERLGVLSGNEGG